LELQTDSEQNLCVKNAKKSPKTVPNHISKLISKQKVKEAKFDKISFQFQQKQSNIFSNSPFPSKQS
jgi:hypothetical protein